MNRLRRSSAIVGVVVVVSLLSVLSSRHPASAVEVPGSFANYAAEVAELGGDVLTPKVDSWNNEDYGVGFGDARIGLGNGSPLLEDWSVAYVHEIHESTLFEGVPQRIAMWFRLAGVGEVTSCPSTADNGGRHTIVLTALRNESYLGYGPGEYKCGSSLEHGTAGIPGLEPDAELFEEPVFVTMVHDSATRQIRVYHDGLSVQTITYPLAAQTGWNPCCGGSIYFGGSGLTSGTLTGQQGQSESTFHVPTWFQRELTADEVGDLAFMIDNEIANDSTPVPRLGCGRTLRDMGNGQWFADVEAIVRNPHPDAVDEEGYWRASWDPTEHYPGSDAIIPLPSNATADQNLYVTYWMRRTTTTRIGWTPVQDATGEWVIGDPTEPAISLPGPIEWIFMLGGNSPYSPNLGTVGPGGSFQMDFENHERWTPLMQVDSVRMGCTIRVSPVTYQDDDDTIVVVIPPLDGEDPDDGTPMDPPGTVTEGECSSSGGGLFGAISDIAKSLWCAIKGLGSGLFGPLVDLIEDLIDALLGLVDDIIEALSTLLYELFVPDLDNLDAEELTAGCGTVCDAATEANETVTAIFPNPSGGGEVTAAGSSNCGPSVDVETDVGEWHFYWPGPAGCPNNGTQFDDEASDLWGYRTPIRTMASAVLWLAFVGWVVRQLPWSKNEGMPGSDMIYAGGSGDDAYFHTGASAYVIKGSYRR